MAGKPFRAASGPMRDVIAFAQKNGFDVSFTKNHHLKFTGHGAVVIGPVTPRNPLDANKTQRHLARVMDRARESLPA